MYKENKKKPKVCVTKLCCIVLYMYLHTAIQQHFHAICTCKSLMLDHIFY